MGSGPKAKDIATKQPIGLSGEKGGERSNSKEPSGSLLIEIVNINLGVLEQTKKSDVVFVDLSDSPVSVNTVNGVLGYVPPEKENLVQKRGYVNGVVELIHIENPRVRVRLSN